MASPGHPYPPPSPYAVRPPLPLPAPLPQRGGSLAAPQGPTGMEVVGAVVDAAAKAGLWDTLVEAVSAVVPELGINYAATKANHTEAGKTIRRTVKVPLSFVGTVVAGLTALFTRGQGTIGRGAVVTAKGQAHATIAYIAAPPPEDVSGVVEGSSEPSTATGTEA